MGEAQGEVERSEGLAFLRHCTRKKKNAAVLFPPQHGNSRAQGAKGFCFRRLRVIRDDQPPGLSGIRFEFGNRSQHWKAKQFLHLVDALESGVQCIEQKDQERTDAQGREKPDQNYLDRLRPHWPLRHLGSLNDPHLVRLQFLRDGGFFNAAEHRLVERAVRFHVARQHVVANGLLV